MDTLKDQCDEPEKKVGPNTPADDVLDTTLGLVPGAIPRSYKSRITGKDTPLVSQRTLQNVHSLENKGQGNADNQNQPGAGDKGGKKQGNDADKTPKPENVGGAKAEMDADNNDDVEEDE